MTRPTIYIAGPFRGSTAWDIECNIRKAECVGLKVAQLGAIPVIPHTMFRYFQGSLPDSFWIEATLTIARLCDGLLVDDYANGSMWRRSVGTEGEVAEMRRLVRPVFFLEDLENGSLQEWSRVEAKLLECSLASLKP